jgi:hypothetical protein
MPKNVKDAVFYLSYELAKHSAVLENYPDATVHYYKGFQSKAVNKVWSGYEFTKSNWGVWISFFYELPFTFDGKSEMVRIFASPRSNRVAYLGWLPQGKIVRFSRTTFNLKNNKFVTSEKLLTDIKMEITAFIKLNAKYPIDDKHLDPRIKKMLSFV